MTASIVSDYSEYRGNGFVRSLTQIAACFSCLIVLSAEVSSASPVSSGRASTRRDPVPRGLLRRATTPLDVKAPYEACFETTCNRITHYCDEIIKGCESCEDDCHPGRIMGDEVATQECLRKCDWYYYLKSLNSAASTPATTEHNTELPGKEICLENDYAYIAIIAVSACFTTLFVVLIGVFSCFIKRLTSRQVVLGQETDRSSSQSIYKPSNQQFHSTVSSKKNQNIETSIKLLANNETATVRSGQQESMQHGSFDRSLNLASAFGTATLSSYNKPHGAQVHAKNGSLLQGPENSSLQPLVR